MIETKFWEDVRDKWIIPAPPKIINIKTGSGGEIDPSLLDDPFEISFDDIDYDESVISMMNGGDAIIKGGAKRPEPQEPEIQIPEEPPKPKRPQLDADAFDECLAKRTLPEYVKACRLLMACQLPADMNNLYAELVERMPVLQDAIDKFIDVYHADIDEFLDYYIPEALELTATYLEYLNLEVGETVISDTEEDVMNAADKLLIAVNDKIEEIYKFASIEIKAKAKALEALMNQNGHIDTRYKM